METVADGVYQVNSGSRSFVIDGDEGLTLVDTGLPNKAGAVVTVIRSIGRSVEDVQAIVLTHSHADHAGNAAALKRTSGAALFCAPGDAPAVRGDEPAPTPPFMDRRPFGILKPLLGLMGAGEPAEVDHEIGPGVLLTLPEDLLSVPTPGHTPGHTSFHLDRAGGILFVGDAANHRRGTVARGWFNRSTPQIDASVRSLAELDFSIACFGHSDPLTTRANAAFKEFARTL